MSTIRHFVTYYNPEYNIYMYSGNYNHSLGAFDFAELVISEFVEKGYSVETLDVRVWADRDPNDAITPIAVDHISPLGDTYRLLKHYA